MFHIHLQCLLYQANPFESPRTVRDRIFDLICDAVIGNLIQGDISICMVLRKVGVII